MCPKSETTLSWNGFLESISWIIPGIHSKFDSPVFRIFPWSSDESWPEWIFQCSQRSIRNHTTDNSLPSPRHFCQPLYMGKSRPNNKCRYHWSSHRYHSANRYSFWWIDRRTWENFLSWIYLPTRCCEMRIEAHAFLSASKCGQWNCARVLFPW